MALPGIKAHEQDHPRMRDKALGCLLGAFIGDAIGVALRDAEEGITDNEVLIAMKMPGNQGPYGTAAGQVSDVGELIMCQLQAICDMQSGKFQPAVFAKWFESYVQSEPLHMGQTTSTALRYLVSVAD